MSTPTLDTVSREIMLRNAYAQFRRRSKNRGLSYWFFVEQITGKGSTSSIAICEELACDHNALVPWPLPPMRP
jgi:hypothetical protein